MTISLPTAMLAKIEHARQMEDRTRSEFVRQAIRVYLAQAEPERKFFESHLKDGDGAMAGEDELRENGKAKDAAATVVDRVRDAIKEAKERI
jgi:Arc/MetJ-type ribon-helix-helix transcriptional regulator